MELEDCSMPESTLESTCWGRLQGMLGGGEEEEGEGLEVEGEGQVVEGEVACSSVCHK